MSEIEEQVSTGTRITVEGTPYLLPALDTFNLDEAMVMFRYSGMTFDQIFELEGLHPGIVAGLLHVAIARSDPSLREREIKRMVSAVNMMNVLEQLAELAEEMPDPTKAEAPPAESDSSRSSSEPTSPSGDSGGDASAPTPERSSPGSTGVLSSVTTATSDPMTSGV